MTELTDAWSLAEKIKSKQISPLEAVEDAIEKIKSQDNYQAIHHTLFDQALAEAETFDRFQAPFAGVPIVSKDLGQLVAGGLNSSGSALLKDNQALASNHFIQALQAAGFIIVGQSNVPEFGIKFISDSQTFGKVSNPVCPSYHAGGSSGGAAAAVQGGLLPIATASDGGGSIRIPASFTGLIGLKPTTGRMPMGPQQWRSWGGGASHFALTKSMRDTLALFFHLQTDQWMAMPYRLPLLKEKDFEKTKTDLKSLRIGLVQRPEWDSDEAMAAVDQIAQDLSDRGFHVQKMKPALDIPALVHSYYQMNGAEMDKILSKIESGRGQEIAREELEPLTWAIRSYGKTISGSQYSALLDLWDQASFIMSEVFEEVDVLIQPTTTQAAPALDEDLYPTQAIQNIQSAEELNQADWEEPLFESLNQANRLSPYALIDNLTGIPAMSLPLWTCSDGRPLGLQLSAAKGREGQLLALGQFLEDEGLFHYYQAK